MEHSRRSFFKLGAAAGLAAPALLSVRPSLAAAPKAGTQVPGLYRHSVGDFEVTAILDGALPVAPGLIVGYDEDQAASALKRQHLPASPEGQVIPVIGYLVNTRDRLIAIDNGSTDSFVETLGNYHSVLDSAGYSADQIDHVIATHLHVDHIGGMADARGSARFKNADLIVSTAEWDFWHNDTIRSQTPEGFQFLFDAARSQTAPYKDKLKLIEKDEEVFPGIQLVALPGHTPGHLGVHLHSQGQQLLIWGDVVHATKLQMDHPDWTIAFDVDADMARATRMRVLDMVVADDISVAGMHLDFPGFGHISRNGSAYRFDPVAWDYGI